MTKALALLPAVAESQGIFRPAATSDFYKTSADVRIDQFSDVDPTGLVEDPNNPGFLLCGCAIATKNVADTAMQVGFINFDGTTDPIHEPLVGVIASSDTRTWHLDALTSNILAEVDSGIPIQQGKWYGVETDFDAPTGALHATITDKTLGTTLYDNTILLSNYGNYDPSVDGVFNTEAYLEGELGLLFGSDPNLNTPHLAVIDNIDTISQQQGHGYGLVYGHDRYASGGLLDWVMPDHG